MFVLKKKIMNSVITPNTYTVRQWVVIGGVVAVFTSSIHTNHHLQNTWIPECFVGMTCLCSCRCVVVLCRSYHSEDTLRSNFMCQRMRIWWLCSCPVVSRSVALRRRSLFELRVPVYATVIVPAFDSLFPIYLGERSRIWRCKTWKTTLIFSKLFSYFGIIVQKRNCKLKTSFRAAYIFTWTLIWNACHIKWLFPTGRLTKNFSSKQLLIFVRWAQPWRQSYSCENITRIPKVADKSLIVLENKHLTFYLFNGSCNANTNICSLKRHTPTLAQVQRPLFMFVNWLAKRKSAFTRSALNPSLPILKKNVN